MHYVLEFGGGLGDVFYQLYDRGAYNVLRDLGPEDTAQVILVCHNPHAQELFEYHPKRSQIDIRPVGYWSPAEDGVKRRALKLPPPGSNGKLPAKDLTFVYHPAPSDGRVLAQLPEHYIVLAAGAGTPDRSFSPELLYRVVRELTITCPYPIVAVGRDYARSGRAEPLVPEGVLNTVNQLSVPGTAQVVQGAAGLVTAHSALNLLGWREWKPQLLLYPQSVLDQHCRNGKYDQWLYGATRSTTTHARFQDFTEEHVQTFVRNVL